MLYLVIPNYKIWLVVASLREKVCCTENTGDNKTNQLKENFYIVSFRINHMVSMNSLESQ